MAFAFEMDHTLLLGLVSMLVLLFCSAMVSGAEVAFFSLSQRELQASLGVNDAKAKLISSLLERPKKLLATLLIAYNFIHLSVILLFFFVAKDLWTKMGPAVLQWAGQLLLAVLLLLLAAKVLAKIAARRNKLRFAQLLVYPIWQLDKLLSPIVLPINSWAYSKHSKSKAVVLDPPVSSFEFIGKEQVLGDSQKILQGIVAFGNTDSKGVMSPRIDIFALDISDSFSAVYSKIIAKGFSRVPVYKDNIDQIVGLLFVKDLLPYINEADFDWTTLLREPFFVPENKKLGELLRDFQRRKSHLAIVVDEYGGTSGLVCLEDIIEEIVGEISDEYDDAQFNFSKIDDKNYIFEGKIYLKDFYKIIEVEQQVFEERKGEAETLGGLILEVLGKIPQKGQKIVFGSCTFVIESADRKRIKQIKVTIE